MFETTTQLIFGGVFPGNGVQIGFAASLPWNPTSICCVLATHPSHKLRAFISPNPSKIEWDLTNRPLRCNRAIRYLGLGLHSVGPTVGDFLDSCPPGNQRQNSSLPSSTGQQNLSEIQTTQLDAMKAFFLVPTVLNQKTEAILPNSWGLLNPDFFKKVEWWKFWVWWNSLREEKNFKLTGYLAPN